MEKVFEQLKDLHVKNYVVFGKAADHKLYAEAAFTNQIEQAALEDMFAKGLVLIDLGEDGQAVPVSIKANKVVTVATVSNAVALGEWSAKATA